ncbi:MAG: periplasmic divalent cation tolerance protein [Acidobacteriota bacterium]|jgi:periplasmic divalent cation tolerance protein|nr:periplasmic divalent cation tolerance protein [Acidobacteriota bacterium]
MIEAVIVLTTVGALFDAKPLARELVERRLCACVSILPRVESIYMWEGNLTEDAEQLLIIKTVAERVDELRDRVLALHPYDVPEFLVLDVAGISGPYREWLLGAVS